jgi:aspartyl-tRNA(Asn)/glutamyl-tRNA(Gln) amidotransferase subunit C
LTLYEKFYKIFYMTIFDKQTLQALGKLARIHLNSSEEEVLLENLTKIVSFINVLNEVDTKGVPPCSHVIKHMRAPMREDEPQRLIPREDFLKNAPDHIGGMIKVPKVIKDQL